MLGASLLLCTSHIYDLLPDVRPTPEQDAGITSSDSDESEDDEPTSENDASANLNLNGDDNADAEEDGDALDGPHETDDEGMYIGTAITSKS